MKNFNLFVNCNNVHKPIATTMIDKKIINVIHFITIIINQFFHQTIFLIGFMDKYFPLLHLIYIIPIYDFHFY